jgi:hypothetical protein
MSSAEPSTPTLTAATMAPASFALVAFVTADAVRTAALHAPAELKQPLKTAHVRCVRARWRHARGSALRIGAAHARCRDLPVRGGEDQSQRGIARTARGGKEHCLLFGRHIAPCVTYDDAHLANVRPDAVVAQAPSVEITVRVGHHDASQAAAPTDPLSVLARLHQKRIDSLIMLAMELTVVKATKVVHIVQGYNHVL